MNQPGQGGQQPSGMPSWTNNLTARGTKPGPGGVALADFTDRAIAYIIDGFIISIVGYLVSTLTTNMLGDNLLGGIFGLNYHYPSVVSVVVAVVLMLAATMAYAWYMWTKMGGATIGMRVMKLSVRDATTGGAISQNQAITRAALVFGPLAIYWGVYGWGIIGLLGILLLIGAELFWAYTIAQSPTRQGFHDVQAKTVVAKG